MTTKIVKDYVDSGYGFDVIIDRVEILRDVAGDVALIDYLSLQDEVLRVLAWKGTRLTGDEIRFVRNAMKKTLKEFGGHFHVSHSCVIKWEKGGDKSTDMNWPTEKDIRMQILSFLGELPTEILRLYDFLALPLKSSPLGKAKTIRVSLPLFSERFFVTVDEEFDLCVETSNLSDLQGESDCTYEDLVIAA